MTVYGFQNGARVYFHEHGFEYERPDTEVTSDGRMLAFGRNFVHWSFEDEDRWSATPDPFPLVPLVVPEAGLLRITTRQGGEVAGAADAVWLAARTKDALIFEQLAADPAQVVTVAVAAREEIFFEAHSHDGSDVSWTPKVVLVPASGGASRELAIGSEVPLNRTRDAVLDETGEVAQIRSPFGGGYHGWRYGAWHGENSAPFDPNGIVVLAPYLKGKLWEALANVLGDPDSLESRAIAATSPLFPRRLGTFAGGAKAGLKPSIPAWVTTERSDRSPP